MTSTNEIGLATDRVQSADQIDLNELVCSTICENILWKPVCCQSCETHFCSMCIEKWLAKHPNQCPIRCESFIQRPCSKFIARQLAKLQVVCFYQSSGCNQIISYEAVEKHELICEYKPITCEGCLEQMCQKDYATHQTQCTSIVKRCPDCKMVYKQSDAARCHTDATCLREQLRQYQLESQNEIQQLRNYIRQTENDQIRLLVRLGIVADNNNNREARRTQLKSTMELDLLDRNRAFLAHNNQSKLTDTVLCYQCRNILWKPVSCKQCRTHYCERCHPPTNIFAKMKRIFNDQAGLHGSQNCKRFEVAPPDDFMIAELAELRIRCSYAPNGCPMILSYRDLEQHERSCEFEMIPCELCRKPLSQRSPTVQHTQRACFEYMHNKNPAAIQQQFMILINNLEERTAENHRFQREINDLKTQLTALKGICDKITESNKK